MLKALGCVIPVRNKSQLQRNFSINKRAGIWALITGVLSATNKNKITEFGLIGGLLCPKRPETINGLKKENTIKVMLGNVFIY